MAQVGFIRNKQEIKFLILYISERLIAPVPFEVLQELTMCDPAIDFFDFSECLSYLVDTGHMECSKDDRYSITEKGVLNGRACADEIPYSVRLTADRLAESQNQQIRRQKQVRSSYSPRPDGTYNVILSFNDDSGRPLWRMELTLPDETKAKTVTRQFQESPEQMYFNVIRVLLPDDREK